MLSGRRRGNENGLWRMVVAEGGEEGGGIMEVDLVVGEGEASRDGKEEGATIDICLNYSKERNETRLGGSNPINASKIDPSNMNG